MISWVRCVLGQVQESAVSTNDITDAVKVWSEKRPADEPVGPPPDGLRSRPRSQWLLAGLIAAIGVALWTSQFLRAGDLERQLSLAKGQATRLQAQNRELTEQVAGLRQGRETLEERVASLDRQLAAASRELEHLSARLADSQDVAKQLSEAHTRFETELADARVTRDTSQAQVDQLVQEKAKLSRSVLLLRQRLSLVQRDYHEAAAQLAAAKRVVPADRSREPSPIGFVSGAPKPVRVSADGAPTPSAAHSSAPSAEQTTTASAETASQAVELPPIVVRGRADAVRTPLSAQLIDVSQPFNFVVIDRGALDGIQEGMTFDILREAVSIGRAGVVRVRPRLAACAVVRADTPGPLRVGDIAVLRGPVPSLTGAGVD